MNEHHYGTGDVIADKYELIEVIGEGGMGSVWRAKNLVLHVDVAVKLIHHDMASDVASRRLLIEARSAARLAHPSIVRVHDFGTTDAGDPFIVMEMLAGESLADLVARGPMTPEEAVQLLLPILDALDVAHGNGIVHRDLKPENILLVEQQSGAMVPKLVDFGIAMLEREMGAPANGSGGAESDNRRITQAGHLVGSPAFMAPEQAQGLGRVDERADLWSLSVVLYEAVTGVLPFDREEVTDILIAVLVDDPIPIDELGVGDPRLWQIIQQGLAKNVEDRWQRAREMGEALAQWLLERGIDADIAGTSIRRHWLGEHSQRGDVTLAGDLAAATAKSEVKPARSTVTGGSSITTKPSRPKRRVIPTLLVAAVLLAGLSVLALQRHADETDTTVTPSSSLAGAEVATETVEADPPDPPVATSEPTASASAQAADADGSAHAPTPPPSKPMAVRAPRRAVPKDEPPPATSAPAPAPKTLTIPDEPNF